MTNRPEPATATAEAYPVPGDPTATARKASGPGLLEALVALGILVSLSGVLMPAIGEEVGEARRMQTLADMDAIATALSRYQADTLTLPTGVSGRTDVAWLYGPGRSPAATPFAAGGQARALEDVLLIASLGGTRWAGPYLGALSPDPWGGAYLVNVDGWLDARERPMILSAGPDGIVQTSPDAREAGGDDLLWLLD